MGFKKVNLLHKSVLDVVAEVIYDELNISCTEKQKRGLLFHCTASLTMLRPQL